jgi:2-oxoacid:acceptor oxidoreductase gamma subunit (pyruvate/2-ketoisovalerate family)
MIAIRFDGRGGQGAVVASGLLAQATFLEGREPQSFPFLGVERRGAEVMAYARIDAGPVVVVRQPPDETSSWSSTPAKFAAPATV